jgi:hypothetical protein
MATENLTGSDNAREIAAEAYGRARGAMSAHPTSSVLLGFGLGFGVGLLLTEVLRKREDTWYARYVPDRMRHMPESLRQIGDSIRHIPDQLAHLPEAVARYAPSR